MKDIRKYINEKMVYASSNVRKQKNINFEPESLDELKSKIIEEIEICDKQKIDCLDLSGYNLHNLENISYLFEETLADGHPHIKTIDVSNWNVSSIKIMTDAFCDCEHIKEIVGLETWDTSNVTDMAAFFMNCENLVDFDISNFNFEKVERLSFFFSGCTSLTSIDISYINCPNCTTINNLFSRCINIKTIDVSNMNVSKCVTISAAFQYCNYLEKIIGLENWDISNVKKMDRFLNGCSYLQEANGLEKWKISDKLEDTENMFGYCTDLVVDLSDWVIDKSKIDATNMCVAARKMKKPKFINK